MNNFLFIDFGASKVKTIEYNFRENKFSPQYQVDSPFLQVEAIHKKDLLSFVSNVIKNHRDIAAIIPCSILGGGYDGELYYSWKANKKLTENTCLLSGLFKGDASYHVHEDHGGKIDKLTFLGKIGQNSFYSSLGDTDCVKRSFPLDNKSCIVNLGTGSQVIKEQNMVKYIPSGRALNSYRSFFSQLGVDIFDLFEDRTVDDLLGATMSFDLNMFEQALNYKEIGGMISGINEKNFTLKNFIDSLFASYLNQYIPYIYDSDKIYLTGGISRRYPAIRDYFQLKTGKDVLLRSEYIEDTFLGIKNKLLEDYEHINHRR